MACSPTICTLGNVYFCPNLKPEKLIQYILAPISLLLLLLCTPFAANAQAQSKGRLPDYIKAKETRAGLLVSMSTGEMAPQGLAAELIETEMLKVLAGMDINVVSTARLVKEKMASPQGYGAVIMNRFVEKEVNVLVVVQVMRGPKDSKMAKGQSTMLDMGYSTINLGKYEGENFDPHAPVINALDYYANGKRLIQAIDLLDAEMKAKSPYYFLNTWTPAATVAKTDTVTTGQLLKDFPKELKDETLVIVARSEQFMPREKYHKNMVKYPFKYKVVDPAEEEAAKKEARYTAILWHGTYTYGTTYMNSNIRRTKETDIVYYVILDNQTKDIYSGAEEPAPFTDVGYGYALRSLIKRVSKEFGVGK